MNITTKRKTIIRAREWAEYNLPITMNLKNDSYCKLLILSTIDCFAQMFGNYPQSNRSNETFCKFILKYSSQHNTLNHICPVTLRNHYMNDTPIQLEERRLYKWDDCEIIEETERIIALMKDETSKEKAIREHRYIKLLYKLRSKLVHELNNMGTKIEFMKDVPSISSGVNTAGNCVWSLNYPRLWIYQLAQETINNFVDDCLKNESLLCFLDKERTLDLTWYV